MSYALSDKDPQIQVVIRALRDRYGISSFAITDHWVSEYDAIGISRVDNRKVLAYIAAYDAPASFFVSLELPPPKGSEMLYTDAGSHDTEDLESVLQIIGEHLGLKATV